ncbi:Noranthrone monooxygenase [Aspergillus caelatus]|uniref:Noranthrone monooxygenase n=1 Tax=Aspergillus caelatus TaxID=61420 RepID=A0A5N6ZXK5_9EURO|nr:Noranthrone monooxygenase [Aspergillus caelatus]KAE8362108.1 Noranthrone monooxygenase [Aspergillus caelatus]
MEDLRFLSPMDLHNVFLLADGELAAHASFSRIFTRRTNKMGTEYVAVLTGSFLTGVMMNLHLLTIPILIETTQQPAQLVHQWSRIFYSGHRKGPGIAIVTGALYGYAAWAKFSVGEPWHHWMVAAVTTVSMVPYTWMFMNATNTALFHAEDRFEKGSVEISLQESVRLVRKWDWLNTVRALFPLAGSVMGMLGVCGVLRY